MTDRGPRWVHAVSLPASDAYQQSGWRPPADVYRLPDGWLIKMELAGVRADQIRIQARGHVLSVSGVRRDLAIDQPTQKRPGAICSVGDQPFGMQIISLTS